MTNHELLKLPTSNMKMWSQHLSHAPFSSVLELCCFLVLLCNFHQSCTLIPIPLYIYISFSDLVHAVTSHDQYKHHDSNIKLRNLQIIYHVLLTFFGNNNKFSTRKSVAWFWTVVEGLAEFNKGTHYHQKFLLHRSTCVDVTLWLKWMDSIPLKGATLVSQWSWHCGLMNSIGGSLPYFKNWNIQPLSSSDSKLRLL